MTITQIHINWLEDNFLFVRTWILEHQQTQTDRDRPIMSISEFVKTTPDIEQFLLTYFTLITAWINHVERHKIAADRPAIAFDDFVGIYDGARV